MPSAVGNPTSIDLSAAPASLKQLDEAMVQAGIVAWDASNSLGIANGLSIRGFAVANQGSSSLQVGRNFLNGHSDMVWRFARDPATVALVEVVSGSDATLLGAGSPAGAVLFTSKSPKGAELRTISAAIGSNGLTRVVGDAEWHWGTIQSRAVLAVQRGDKGAEGVADERTAVLLSNKLQLGAGVLQLDIEAHQNTTPFTFGTVYAGGKFWYDQAYVDPRSNANRIYHRQAIYYDQAISDAAHASVYWQRGQSTRNETLLGFFDPLNASTLRGYYRTIDEKNHQSDFGFKLNGRTRTGSVLHQWTGVWQHLGLTRDFAGPQNIGGFSLSIANPVFPTSMATLALVPRFALESYRERGFAIADTMQLGSWEARLGIRRSSYALTSSTNPALAAVTVADAAHTNTSFGINKTINASHRIWLSRTTSFLPNRGYYSNGAFLPPSVSKQLELGWQHQSDTANFSLAVFDLSQSNLPAKDPNDANALVVIGSNRSKGVEAKADALALGLRWQAAFTHQRVRVQDKISATQGDYLAGSPAGYGSLHINKTMGDGWQTWLRIQAAASRPGDDKASFSAPGYSVLSLGLDSNPHSTGLRWSLAIQNAANLRYVRALTGADNVWQGARRSLNVWVLMPH